ncbi:MAG TPA: glycoside hydrolase family 3 N-terminal domain-containing protein [Solirubrobacteraceae bacterium]|jgi:beta-N-acetylhexosaminidase|nr:glycoside hydrolase family 3 N-terminal domain-containing protein [Solirubrobacteraceae bacterium]
MVEQDRRRRLRRLLAAAGVLMAVAAVVLLVGDPFAEDGSGGGGDGGDVPEAGSRFRGEDRSLLDALRPVLAAEPASPPLPVEQAVAQLFAVGFEGREPPRALLERMRSRAWGVVLVGATNYGSPSQVRDAVGALEEAARRGRQAPPLVATEPAALGRLGPPPAPDIGLDGTPEEARAEALDAARRLRSAHVRMVLGPSADLAVGGGPSAERGFSDDPREAAAFVEAAVRGWKEARVVVAPGRFPGEGGASQDPLFGAATVGLSVDELLRRDVEPFRGAVRAGADAVQMSAALFAAWDGVTPATVLPDAVRFLRSSTGFRGAVVSADLVAVTAATGGGVARAAVEAVRAGCDLLVLAGGAAEQEAAYQGLLAAVRSGEVPRDRLDEAVRRVAAMKAAAQAPR